MTQWLQDIPLILIVAMRCSFSFHAFRDAVAFFLISTNQPDSNRQQLHLLSGCDPNS